MRMMENSLVLMSPKLGNYDSIVITIDVCAEFLRITMIEIHKLACGALVQFSSYRHE
jgi:hypothetical protein